MNRPARAFFLLLALGALSTVSALYLETTIPLGAARGPIWSPIGNKVYVLSTYEDDFTTVIDGATNLVIANIRVAEYPTGFAVNTIDGKVYCISGDRDRLNIICPYGDSLIRQVRLTGYPTWPRYSARLNKLYVIGQENDCVYALNAYADTILSRVTVRWPMLPLLQPYTDRLFVQSWTDNYSLVVIDCVADTVVARHAIARPFKGPGCMGAGGSVYLPCESLIEVYSADGEARIAQVPIPVYGTWASAYSPRDAKVYFAGGESSGVTVVDCRTNRFTGTLAFGNRFKNMTCDTINGRLYAATYNRLFVFDTRNDSLSATVPIPGNGGWDLAWNPVNRRLYIATGNSVCVIRDTTSGIEEAQPGPSSAPLAPTVVRGILRLPAPTAGTLLDASGRAVLALKPGPNDVSRLAPGVYFVLTPHPAPLPQGAREPSSTISKLVLTR